VPLEQMGQSEMNRLWRQKRDTWGETIRHVRAAIVSDLHLGTAVPAVDVARSGEPLERLVEAVSRADTVVLAGDMLELREGPVAGVLEAVRPVFERLGAAAAGKRMVLVPGNHDHELTEPFLARARLESSTLGAAAEWPVTPADGSAGRLAEWMPDVDMTLAYPGTWVREDVYVTHGHYLDVQLTVPRLEALAASAMGRLTGRGRSERSPEDYEAVLGPLYGFFYRYAQSTESESLRSKGSISRRVWSNLNGGSGSRVARFALGRVTIPGAVALINRAGLGPFRSELSGETLRRAGLEAMSTVVDGFGLDADHVVFGHTHRAGPLPRDDPSEWRTPAGVRLWNSGSWLKESVLIGGGGPGHPYWPGTVVQIPEEGDPEIVNVLRDAPLPATP
jgi:predicted phosphodiesterase